MDFFAGSGTTGDAVMRQNRQDGGARRFVLVEQGDYFEQINADSALTGFRSLDLTFKQLLEQEDI